MFLTSSASLAMGIKLPHTLERSKNRPTYLAEDVLPNIRLEKEIIFDLDYINLNKLYTNIKSMRDACIDIY